MPRIYNIFDLTLTVSVLSLIMECGDKLNRYVNNVCISTFQLDFVTICHQYNIT